MAEEDIRLIKKILSIPALRAYSRRLKLKALSNAHLHASRVSGKAFLTRATHYAQYVLYYPPNLVRDGNGVKASASVCFGSARIFLSHMVSSFLHAFERMRTKKCKENLGKSGQDLEDLAQLIYQVATTGTGSDKCLEYGCLPLPVNFYSPVPDLRDLEQRGIWDRRSPLSGIDFRQEEQARFLSDLGKVYGRECRWPRQKTTDRVQFHTENDCFGFGCAAALHCMIRHLKPARIVEIGSGNSSLVVSAALGRNAEENPLASCDYTIIDPFPNETISEGMLPRLTRLISQRVEVAGDFFADLRQNDILFVDSSHTIRAGGDVNYLILDILPSLAPGVVIHFHDIDLPYEYPKVYFTNPKFRVFWTEAYLLQAFLACNDHFEILLAMRYLMKEREDEFKKAFPFFSEHSDMPSSGSFWIRRK